MGSAGQGVAERHFFIFAPRRGQTRFYSGAEVPALDWGLVHGPGGTRTMQLAHPGAVLSFLQPRSAGNEGPAALPFQLQWDASSSFKGRRTRLKVFLISKILSDPGRKILQSEHWKCHANDLCHRESINHCSLLIQVFLGRRSSVNYFFPATGSTRLGLSKLWGP